MEARCTDPGAERLLEHARWIRRLAGSLVADPASADDLVQDTWVAALSHPPEADRPLRPWLRTVLRNLARRASRHREEPRIAGGGAEQQADRPEPEELCEQLELQRILIEELARLDEPFRTTLFLRFYRDLAPVEIARRTRAPDGTVRWRLKRGLELLRQRLDVRHDGDRRVWSALLLPLVRPPGAAAVGAAAPAVALPGLLAMNTILKVATAAAAVLLAALGLTLSGILPDSYSIWTSSEKSLAVAFRPIAQEHPEQVAPVLRDEAAGVERRLVAVGEETITPPTPAIATATVEAVITDETGRPLPRAWLREVTEAGPLEEASCRADGSVVLGLDAGESTRGVFLEACARGFASKSQTIRVQAAETVRLGTIMLPLGGAVSGRVIDEEGRPVPGAVIHVGDLEARRQTLEMSRFAPTEMSVPRTASDLRGDFTLWGLPEGFTRLWARCDGWLPSYTPMIEVKNEVESFGVEIVMKTVDAENSIRGVVLDPAGGPVPQARLEFVHSSNKIGLTIGDVATADPDGTFEFVLASDAALSITARDPLDRYGPAAAEKVPTGEQDLELRLTEAREIRLTVLGEDGRPVDRFSYELLIVKDGLSEEQENIHPGSGGEAVFRLPGREFAVRVEAPLHAESTVGPFHPGNLGDSVEVRLPSVPGLPGTVLIEHEPASDALVTLHAVAQVDQRIERNGFRCWMAPRPLDQVRTDAGGRFVLTARDSGEYVVRAELSGWAPAEWGPFTLGRDLGAAPIELRLSRGGAIEGRVVLPFGTDPTGTLVGIHRGDGNAQVARVDADGLFRFDGLTPGPWRVEERDEEVIRSYIQTTQHAAVRPFEKEVEWNCEVREGETTFFDLRSKPTNALRLVGTLRVEGTPPHSWTAYLLPSDVPFFDLDGRWPSCKLDPKGRFELGVPDPGHYTLALKSTLEIGEEQFFWETVRLDTDITEWSLEVETGGLVVENLPTEPGPDGMPSLIFVWEGRGGVRYANALIPDENGVSRTAAVPAGEGRFLRPVLESLDFESWPQAGEVLIPEGETVRILAP